MANQAIKGSEKLAKEIKARRKELNLTIEEAAKRANVGTKTWYRYEAGESIRSDKYRGICRALNWIGFPESDELDEWNNIEFYRNNELWSNYLSEFFGEYAAISFIVGSDILLDHIKEDLESLSKLPRGSHVGQLDCSFLSFYLPEQFLMRYDYDFLYSLKLVVMDYRRNAKNDVQIIAHSVLQELALYLIVEYSRTLLESLDYIDNCWDEWIFDIFDDMDIVTLLYSDLMYITEDCTYHFNHWMENQFFMGQEYGQGDFKE